MEQDIETFVGYVPMDRRQALAHGATLGDRASGAVLFADISGFTPLTSALYRELGPQRGAEELDHILNHIFDPLIGRIHQYRGSVISFSGDAITCWFDGDDGLWATACALDMQDVMANMGSIELPGGGSLPLDIKASVAAGIVRRLIAGDEAIQIIDTLAGELIEHVVAGEKVAASGEVIVSEDIARNVGKRLLVAGQRTVDPGLAFSLVSGLALPVEGRPWLNLPVNGLTQDSLQPWLLPPVYDRLHTGHGQFLAELRNSVALFLHFDGLDYDSDPHVGEKLDNFIRRVQDILAYYGGSLLNLTIGDKGSYLLCSFGAPVAHEDDARRAASAALDLLALPGELEDIDDVRIGISQGIMFSGAYGGANRRTYGILGEETNIAARLMGQAETGQALVTDRIAQATNQSHSFQALPPVSVKGIAEPILVHRLLARWQAVGQISAAAESEMVGRIAERALLLEQLLALQNGGAGGVTIIEGEAGIGKSRLLEDLVQKAEAQDQPVYLGAADAIEKNAAYHAWRGIFWDLFELDSAPDAEPPGAGRLSPGQRQLVFDRLGTAVPDKEHLAPLLNAVLPTDLPDNDLTAQMTGEVRAGNTQDLLIALLKNREEETPLLLIIEDAHWLDSASWALARLVSRDIPALLLVIATRPLADPLPSEYSALLARTNTEHLALSTLPPGETLQLVRLRLGVEELPKAVEELLLEKAGGHPFFSEELAYALRDAGLLVIENGSSRLAAGEVELAALTFPDSIDSVITSRIDLLTPQQQLTLKVASVIGRVFPYSTLYDIHPVAADRPRLHEQLDTLERLDITPLETPEPDLSYIFKHIITQEVAYNLMSFAQRQGLHQAIAEWIETTYSDDLAPHYPLLAYHYQKALGDEYGRSDLVAKTMQYLSQAADRSLNNYANREAIEYYRELLRLDDLTGNQADTFSRPRWQRGLGEANFRLGNWEAGSKQIEAAVALMGHPMPSGNLVLGLNLVAQLLRQAYFRLRSSEIPSSSQMSSQASAEVVEASKGYRLLSLTYWFREELVPFLYSGVYYANLAQQLGISDHLKAAFAGITAMLGSVPGQPLADSYFGLTTAMHPESDDVAIKAWTNMVMGLYLLETGRWEEGLRVTTEGASFSAEVGYRRSWEENWGLSAVLLCNWGKFGESVKRWEEVYASANRRDDSQLQVWSLCGRVENALWTDGIMQDSIACLQESLVHLNAKNISLSDHIRTRGLLALVYMRQGKYEHGRQEADAILELINQSNLLVTYAYDGYVAPVDVYLSLWEMEAERQGSNAKELSRLARQGLKKSRELGRTYPIFKPRSLFYQGRFDWLSGKQRKAQKAWVKGVDLAFELDMPHEAGLLHLEVGRHLLPGDPERQEHLTRALDLFTNVGAHYFINRTREEMNIEQAS
jgi:class 3 adenylate cyclase